MTSDLNRAQELHRSGEYEAAHQVLVECLEDDETLIGAWLLLADNLLRYCPEADNPFLARRAAANAALTLSRELSDKRSEARALLTLSSVDLPNGLSLAAESLSAAKSCGDKKGTADALRHMASRHSTLGDRQEAFSIATQAVAVARQLDDNDFLSQCLFTLGIVASDPAAQAEAFGEMASLKVGSGQELDFACRIAGAASLVIFDDVDLAETWWHQCLEIARSLGNVGLEGVVCRGLAEVASSRGEKAKAEELLAMADVLCPVPHAAAIESAVRKLESLLAKRR